MAVRKRYRSSGPRRIVNAVAAIALFAVAALAAAWLEPAPTPLNGRAIAADGDSLRLGEERVRLLGIDAPELDQPCDRRGGTQWPCGVHARDRLATLLRGGDVQCVGEGRDRYNRVLARCTVGGRDLAGQMVASGLAIATDGYWDEEKNAETRSLGIWAGGFQNPADWRAGREPQGLDPLGWVLGLFGR